MPKKMGAEAVADRDPLPTMTALYEITSSFSLAGASLGAFKLKAGMAARYVMILSCGGLACGAVVTAL